MRQCEIVVPTMPVRFYLLRIGVGNNRCHKQTVLFRPACCLGLGSGCSERAVSRLCRRIRSANRISRQLSAATSTVTLRTLTHLRVRVVRGLSRAPLRRRSTAEESGPEHRTWRKGTPAAPATWELTIRSGRCTRRRSTASGICSSRPARYPKTRPRPPARTATCPRETMKCARLGVSWRCGCRCPRTRNGSRTKSRSSKPWGSWTPKGTLPTGWKSSKRRT